MLGSSSEVKIRKPRVGDAKPLSEIFSTSWWQTYRGIIPHSHLENLVRRRGPDWWRNAIRTGDEIVVMDVAGATAGYATLGASRSRGAFAGEIYELYIAPNYQGLGFGEHLFEACRNNLDQRRYRGLIVWVLSDNTHASDFYWRRGGRPVARTVERVGTAKLEKIAFAWT